MSNVTQMPTTESTLPEIFASCKLHIDIAEERDDILSLELNQEAGYEGADITLRRYAKANVYRSQDEETEFYIFGAEFEKFYEALTIARARMPVMSEACRALEEAAPARASGAPARTARRLKLDAGARRTAARTST